MRSLSGQTVQGYDLLERIGAGGFGAVYRAYQSTVGREVAVKVILPAFANKPDFIRRFEIEAQLVARLEHLHVVPLYDYWRDPHGAYIVMRWLRGGSLRAALRAGPFDLEPASSLLDQVAAGLAAAHHKQIVHRDLKPSNILLDEDGNAYLADFGIARDLHRSNGAGRGQGKDRLDSGLEERIPGSIQYLSPEQLRGQEATPQSDIYSLGITLYEVLSGQHPFPGLNSVQQLYKHIDEPLPRIETPDPGVSVSVNEVLQKATAKNPKHRFQDALAMAAAFRDACRLDQSGDPADLVESLTRREQEILHFIIEGNTNQQIAQNLFLELSTVKWHINRIYKKLGVRSRVQAIVRARELDLIVSANERELESEHKTSISIVLPEPANPYKGLRAFEPADNRDFYGREALVDHLLSRLAPKVSASPSRGANGRARNGSERFLALVGPSGSGKSSLIKAGLIPALWSGRLAGSDKWFIVDMLPGARPLDDLEIALTRIAADQAGNLREHLYRDSYGLARAARLILPNDGSELVVFIDQFEELFTLAEDESERKQFMDLIQGAVTDPRSRVRVIVSLRADYYDRPLQYPAFGELIRGGLETLLPLSAEELERAIVKPAHQAGVTFEPGLVATIIEDVAYRPGALPLLQFALAELFEQRDGRLLTQRAYQALGGAAGALARRAEDLYQERDAEGRAAIHQLFLRLVSVIDQTAGAAPDVASAADTRKRVLRSELLSASSDVGRLDDIIDTYAEHRLLALDHHPATRRATVEVAHEAILREWDRLHSWLEESRADLTLHHQLVRATREWIEAGGDQSFLLRGTRLDRFESWVSETSLVLTEDEQAYLETSIEQKTERAAAERRRQEQKARLERQSNRRLKALVAVMAVALVVAVGLAVAAVSFAQRVEEQDRLNLAQGLASAARANLELDPELGVLLALEAAETTYSMDGTLLPDLEGLLRKAVRADRVHFTAWLGGTVAFSPDGQIMAVSDDIGRVGLWDVATGEEVRGARFRNLSAINDITFSPDGRLLATSSALTTDAKVKISEIAGGRMVGEIEGAGVINGLAFSPDGKRLATAAEDGQVQIWDTAPLAGGASDKEQAVQLSRTTLIMQAPRAATSVAFGPDGERLAVLVPGHGVIVWDTSSGEQVLEVAGSSVFAAGIGFSSDGNVLAGASGDARATVWDASTGQALLTVHEASTILAVSLSPDGRYLATAAENGKATLWNAETGRELLRLSGHETGIDSVAFSPDGHWLSTSSKEGVTRIWDITSPGDELFSLIAHQGDVYDAVYSPDGTIIASTGEDGAVNLWDAATGELLLTRPGQANPANFPAFSPDGGRLAAANHEGGVSIWDAHTGEELLALRGHTPAFAAVAFSPDGLKLAAGGLDGVAHIWDAATGQRLIDLSSDGDTIVELIFSPDGKGIRTYDWRGLGIAWDASTGERLDSHDYGAVISDVEITADGQLGAMACQQTRIFQPQAQQEAEGSLYMLGDVTEDFTGVALSPQGTLLATSTSDGLAQLWDMATGRELATLSNGAPSLGGVDFSQDGRYLVTAGSNGMLSVYTNEYAVSIEELMEVARSRLSRGFTLEECWTYLHLPLSDCLDK